VLWSELKTLQQDVLFLLCELESILLLHEYTYCIMLLLRSFKSIILCYCSLSFKSITFAILKFLNAFTYITRKFCLLRKLKSWIPITM